MKFKKSLLLLATLPLFAACDQVDEENRYIPVDKVKAERRVLLEEFTGQFCVNCPTAHAVIETLEEQYPEDLIVVSIHAGPFGVAAPIGLMQPDGDIYANHWNIPAYPKGIIDRQSGVLDMGAWLNVIRSELAQAPALEVDLDATLSADGTTINITTDLLPYTSLDGNLQLWVVENQIVSFQQNGDVLQADYIHNNVYRASVNGIWGQPVKLTQNVSQQFDNSIEVNQAWNVDNLYIVGFVYDDAGVQQVNRCKVM